MDDTPSAYAADDVSEEVLVAEDSRVACLAFVASFFGRPFSARAVLDGLPIDPGVGLTPDQLLRALARLGLEAKLFRRAPSSVPAVFLPCIVLLKNGDGAVVVDRSRNGRRLAVVLPSVSSKKRWMSSKDLDRDSSGFLFYVGHGDADDPDTTANKHIKSRNSHWFWGPMLRLWPAWLQIAIAAFAINLLGLATPIFIMNVYDRVIPNLAIPTLWALAVGVGLALVFELTLRQLRTVVLDQASQRIDLKVSSYLFEHALGVSMVERQESTGALASRLRDFDGVKDFFASASLIALIDLIFIFIFVWLLWFIVGELALVTLAAVPIVIIVTLLLQIPLARAVAHAQRHGSQRQGILIEGLGAIETVKTVGAESVLQRRWEEAVVANARHSSRVRF
ncbi:MAG: ABC transporter transmembrane domain-containing protein, partial [Pseudomonadota bacterium]